MQVSEHWRLHIADSRKASTMTSRQRSVVSELQSSLVTLRQSVFDTPLVGVLGTICNCRGVPGWRSGAEQGAAVSCCCCTAEGCDKLRREFRRAWDVCRWAEGL
jgi:hypothetical protein